MLASHLNQNIFDPHVERVPNREGYGQGLLEAGKHNSKVVALAADLTESTKTHYFANEFPERFVQIGIAEQNMASVASGMAAMGKIPFIASYAMFSPGRSWEQVRTTIAYNDANVKIVGAHAGVSVGPDGATHQAVEDIAIMRVIPNMTVIAPCDVHEAKKVVLAAADFEGPVYIRIAREKTPVMTTVDTPFEIGKATLFMEVEEGLDKKIGFISNGPILHEVMVAAAKLNTAGVGASVLNMATVKPLDTDALASFAADHDLLVTVEEHQVAGGLGSAVAEYLSETSPKHILRLGINDRFGQSGTIEDLYTEYGLSAALINERVHQFVIDHV